MNRTTRIEITDTLQSAILKLSEGNPGALTVLIQSVRQGGGIDPDGFIGGLGPLMWLDEIGIYGSRIWQLYKDRCGEDLTRFIAVIRGYQLGIDKDPFACDVDAVLAKVKERLPAFGRAGEAVASS